MGEGRNAKFEMRSAKFFLPHVSWLLIREPISSKRENFAFRISNFAFLFHFSLPTIELIRLKFPTADFVST